MRPIISSLAVASRVCGRRSLWRNPVLRSRYLRKTRQANRTREYAGRRCGGFVRGRRIGPSRGRYTSRGCGLCDIEAVETLVNEGTKYIKQLIEWGTEFDREGGRLVFTQEAAHSRRRILHAHGDSTGKEIVRALIARARQETQINLLPFATTESLIVHEGRCIGVSYLDPILRSPRHIFAKAVIILHGRCRPAFSAHDQPAGCDGRRDGDGVLRGRGDGRYGIHPVSSDSPKHRRRSAIFAVRGDARRGWGFAERRRRAVHGAIRRTSRAGSARHRRSLDSRGDPPDRFAECFSRHDRSGWRISQGTVSRRSTRHVFITVSIFRRTFCPSHPRRITAWAASNRPLGTNERSWAICRRRSILHRRPWG